MDKPFKTIEQQVEMLELRGVKTDDDTPVILLREGYYSVVNGYKAPFIDEVASKEAGDDRYLAGTKFSDIYSLFLFDRELRELTFHFLLKIEAMVRTICSYTFSENHRECDAYLVQTNYATREEYESFGLSNYMFNMQKLHGILSKKATQSERDFIKHYAEKHGWVPLWVLSNDLTFGNIEHFFNLMKPNEQNTVCKRIAKVTGRIGGKNSYLDPKRARSSIDVIVKVRNMCAHDERLYCAKIGGRRNLTYVEFIAILYRYLTDRDFKELVRKVADLSVGYSASSGLVNHILDRMGFTKSIDELEASNMKLR